MVYSKTDLIFLINYLNPTITYMELATKRKDMLESMISPSDLRRYRSVIEERRIERKQYNGNIDYNANLYGVPKSYTKEMKIDILLGYAIKSPPSIDKYQEDFIKTAECNNVYGLAGPGAGKTETLVNFIRRNITKNILCLMFGKNAKNNFERRVKYKNTKLMRKSQIGKNGIFIMTFHEYAYHSRLGYISDSFNELITSASKIEPMHNEKWDYVIIDEAQDIKKIHYDLIKTINTRYFIYMGDPRQQLYDNAYIFSSLINDNKDYEIVKLKSNYRSSSLLIKKFNEFSSKSFNEKINIIQDYGDKLIGEFKVEICDDIDHYATVVADHLISYPQGETFIISPVTIKKFRTSNTITNIRQRCYQLGRPVCMGFREKELDNCNDYILNSYAAKGLERDQVIIICSDNTEMYSNYSVSKTTLKCLYYVAMSRAVKKLVLVFSKSQFRSDNLLLPLLKGIRLPKNNKYVGSSPKPRHIYPVVDCADYFNLGKIKYHDKTDVNPAKIDGTYIEDITGLYVEYMIASKLDLLKKSYKFINKGEKFPTSDNIDTYIVRVDKGAMSKKLKNYIDSISGKIVSPYEHIKINYSIKVNEEWTLSDNNLSDLNLDLSDYIEIIKDSTQHQFPINYAIPIDRSDKTGVMIAGNCDFIGDNIYEIKHAMDNETHHKQACLYNLLIKKDTYLVNTFNGFYNKIEFEDKQKTIKYLRAGTMLKSATVYKNKIPEINLDLDINIFFDIEFETNGFGPNCTRNIREISIIVVNIAECMVVDIFHESYGVRDLKDCETGDIFEKLTGLKIIGKPAKEEDFDRIQEFLNKYENYPLIQWGTCDDNLLREKGIKIKNNTVDLMKIYKKYKFIRDGIKYTPLKAQHKLEDAINYLILDMGLEWEPHRSFEDTLMTAAAYMCMALE